MLFLVMNMEFKAEIMLHCLPEMKCQQNFTTEIGCQVYNLLGYTVENAQWCFQCRLNLSLNPACRDSTGCKRIGKDQGCISSGLV